MDKNSLKNIFSGVGRINRRQYLIMTILIGFFIFALSIMLQFGIMSLIWPVFLVGTDKVIFFSVAIQSLVIIIGSFMTFPYFVRRGHDFGIKTFLSTIFAIISLIIPLLPNEFPMKNILLSTTFLLVLVYIIYPGNKAKNSYGNMPADTNSPSRIFAYLKTGNWNINPKL